MKRFLLLALCSALFSATCRSPSAAAQGKYKNFKVAIYIVVGSSRQLADPERRQRQFERVMRQVKFDKVYLEVYRDRQFADEESIDQIKQFFASHGVEVSGGVTLAAGGQGGQFGTFDYELPPDRAECRRAVEFAARHFDEVMLDDFFFYTSKSDADIAAKGDRSWTQYRLETMRKASEELVLEPARAVNPDIKMIIKYPNWYEHFQGLGYDLEVQPRLFDAIYTGTETRDPYVTDQLLQQYESYLIFRYFDSIRPDGGNRGGWVDTFSTQYVDRYAEQLWLTMFAKAPEITLFNWAPMSSPERVAPGDRQAWADKPTSFQWDDMVASYQTAGDGDDAPGWGRAAGYSLEQVDQFLGKLGKPIGLWSYKPYHSTGEDFLHNYLGNIGIPIELTAQFPTEAEVVLLTECAKFDPEIVPKIKAQLVAGKSVVITSGLLAALQGKGIEDILEVESTGRKVAIRDFLLGYGAGSGRSLNDPAGADPAILFPEIRFFTNDSWGIIRGVAEAKGFPIVLMNRYSQGVIYVLAIPENIADLYNLPQGVVTAIKQFLQPDFPVRIESPALVSLFAYDNGAFIVESFRDEEADVTVSLAGRGAKLRSLLTDETVEAEPPRGGFGLGRRGRGGFGAPRTDFSVKIQPHSYMVFTAER
jgi:hypothetical protein